MASVNSSSSVVSSTFASTSSTVSSTPQPMSLNHAHHFICLKLTSKNYLYWKTQMLPYLCGQKLHGYVDGSLLCPPATIMTDDISNPNPAHSSWASQDQLLMNEPSHYISV
ncbi:hypothetical protein ACSBR2_026353 [Camellia fascicularis]